MPERPHGRGKGPPRKDPPGGPATFMAARRGWSSDGGLSPAKHGRVPAFGTPPRRHRRRSSLLALRSRAAQHGRYLRGPARTAANTVNEDQKQPYNRAGPHRRASHRTPMARIAMRQASPAVLASAASRSERQALGCSEQSPLWLPVMRSQCPVRSIPVVASVSRQPLHPSQGRAARGTRLYPVASVIKC